MDISNYYEIDDIRSSPIPVPKLRNSVIELPKTFVPPHLLAQQEDPFRFAEPKRRHMRRTNW